MYFFKIYIDFPRAELIQRISKRTEQMIKIGAIAITEAALSFA